MNIIISFYDENFDILNNPLLNIFEKKLFEYVLDNLTLNYNDKIFIIYDELLDKNDFKTIINIKYPYIHLISINKYINNYINILHFSLNYIITNHINSTNKCIILNYYTFYTQDIINIFRNSDNSIIFYTEIDSLYKNLLYLSINLDYKNNVLNIFDQNNKNLTNSYIYAFTDINILYKYCQKIINNNIISNDNDNLYYIIKYMLYNSYIFIGYKLLNDRVFHLGTQIELNNYIENTHAFLFDLDGTMVITEHIYFDAWKLLLNQYDIILTKDIFKEKFKGNDDKTIIKNMFPNIDICDIKISYYKNKIFIENIHKIELIDGIIELLQDIKKKGHKACIVTNSKKFVATKIINHLNFNKYIDFVITSEDSLHGKPNPEPYQNAIKKYNINKNKCLIFEDSKTGLLSGKSTNPKVLIGIESFYNSNELLDYGVNISLKNFNNININNLMNT